MRLLGGIMISLLMTGCSVHDMFVTATCSEDKTCSVGVGQKVDPDPKMEDKMVSVNQ